MKQRIVIKLRANFFFLTTRLYSVARYENGTIFPEAEPGSD